MNNNLEFPNDAVDSIQQFFSGETKTEIKPHGSAFYQACQIVAQHAHINLCEERDYVHQMTPLSVLKDLATRSQFRYREINLTGNWWKEDNGLLLGFNINQEPIALIPDKDSYYSINGSTGDKIIIDRDNVNNIMPKAFYFYRSLPAILLSAKDLFKFIFVQIKNDIIRVLLIQVVISLLALIIPLATGYLFSTAVPYAEVSGVTQVVLALLFNAVVVGLFSFTQIIGFLRIKFKSNVSLQSGLWDRVLRFPVSFFKKFQAGDLTNRISSVDAIQQELTLTLILSLSNITVVIFLFAFLLYLSPILTGIILIPIFMIGLFSLFITLRQIKILRVHFQLLGEVYSILLQIFSSINKIKVAHRELKAFKIWSERFIHKSSMFYKYNILSVTSNLFNLIVTSLITIIFYGFIIYSNNSMSIGVFMMYNAAFSMMFAALLSIWTTVNQLVRVIPLYERGLPILRNLPEDNIEKLGEFKLKGNIELNDVVFRYPESSDAICNHLSLKMNKGDYVGILGQSGVGKSTLIRLLIGFEKPLSGNILYDGMDLNFLNLTQLRNQLSVILQTSALMPGTILDNIIGLNTGLTIDEAWEAASLAQIKDEIEGMPMGMQTFISERGASISMGQRQRILIARALAKNPKILILDEAMSGLDDETLIQIKNTIDNLDITRIVITHRPRFLSNANSIHILEAGQFIANGDYNELKKLGVLEKYMACHSLKK